MAPSMLALSRQMLAKVHVGTSGIMVVHRSNQLKIWLAADISGDSGHQSIERPRQTRGAIDLYQMQFSKIEFETYGRTLDVE
jgi:hypothetical protein